MIITIADHKGGVGKTTTAAAIAQGIDARKKKGKALLIDADAQGSATKSVYGATGDNGGLYDAIMKSASAADLIQKTEAGEILPYSRSLALLDKELGADEKRDFYIKEAIEPIKGNYEHIIIDTAPGLSTCLIQALTASEGVIIPLGANSEGVESLQLIHETIEEVKAYTNPSLKVLGVLITQHQARANLTRQYEEFLADLCKDLKYKLLKTRIRQGIAIQEAHALKENLFTYAPKAKATEDYKALIKELKL
jgi:chromosome partitioning protein